MGKCKDNKLQPNKADKGRNQGPSTAAKAALAILGVGFVAGTDVYKRQHQRSSRRRRSS